MWRRRLCAGSGSHAPAPGAPLLLGRPLATAPLDDAEQQVYARASASLAVQAPALDGERETWQPALRTCLERRITTLQELNRTLERLPRDARGRLFASIVVGVGWMTSSPTCSRYRCRRLLQPARTGRTPWPRIATLSRSTRFRTSIAVRSLQWLTIRSRSVVVTTRTPPRRRLRERCCSSATEGNQPSPPLRASLRVP